MQNQARLQLFALAYNLGNFLRLLAPPRSVRHWSLTTLREKLFKIGTKVVRHAKYVTFRMAKVAVPQKLFATILERIQRFGVPPPLVLICSACSSSKRTPPFLESRWIFGWVGRISTSKSE